MEIETVQNVVLIGLGILIFMMYITAKVWDKIAEELDEEKKSR